jgi:hypothetical protein
MYLTTTHLKVRVTQKISNWQHIFRSGSPKIEGLKQFEVMGIQTGGNWRQDTLKLDSSRKLYLTTTEKVWVIQAVRLSVGVCQGKQEARSSKSRMTNLLSSTLVTAKWESGDKVDAQSGQGHTIQVARTWIIWSRSFWWIGNRSQQRVFADRLLNKVKVK